MRIFFIALTLLVSVVGCQSNAHQILAQVLLTQGNAQLVRQDSSTEKLRLADTLGAGSRVRIGSASEMGVTLAPGVMALLDEQTEMTINELEMQKSGSEVGARHARVTLRRGLARFAVGAPPDRHIDLAVVVADAGQLHAEPGALFSVAVHEQSARVTCARGTVRCMDKTGRSGIWVQAGDFLDLGGSESDPQPDEVLAETETRHELAALFIVNDRLVGLQNRQRTLTPFQE